MSTRNEHERRAAKQRHQQGVIFGEEVLGDVAVHVIDEPQSMAAWAKDADGERRLAAHLDQELPDSATVLHDRRVPKTRGNIDHLVVAPTGVWVIDAKNSAGRVERRNAGSWRRPEPRLYVKNRDETELVGKMDVQSDAVRAALKPIGFATLPVRRCLCFTSADWSSFSRPFTIDDVWIGWPQALTRAMRSNPILGPAEVVTVAHHLSAEFPASS